MKSLQMIKFDFIHFRLYHRNRFLLPLLFGAASYLLVSVMSARAQEASAAVEGIWGMEPDQVSFMEWWYYIFSGLEVLQYQDRFQVPAGWIVSNLLFLYSLSGYISLSRTGMGKLAMIKCGSFIRWILGKSVLNLVSVVVYYGLMVCPVLLWTGLQGNFFSSLRPEILDSLSIPYLREGTEHPLFLLVFLPILCSFSLVFLMELLELYFGATISFLSMAVAMVASAYLAWPVSDSLFVMLRRTTLTVEGTIPWIQIVMMLSGSILVSLILSWMKCRTMDADLESEKK